jgi:RNA polymerase sigma-70 factor (ECF subfamily)
VAREREAISLVRLVPPIEAVSQRITPEPPEIPLALLDLDSLFRRYSSYVAAVAHRLLGRDEEVDDTIQEVFLVAVRSLKSVRDPGAIKGWLARITVRTARQRLRKRRMRTLLGLEAPVAYEHLSDAGANGEDRALLARVYRVLDALPANHRVAWSLRYIEGEPLENVASLCGCSLATAKRRIAAAARVIQETFTDA